CTAAGSCGGHRANERVKTQTRGAGGRTRATAAAANRHPSGADPARAAAAARVGRNARHADPSAEAGARARAAALPVGNIVRSLVSRFRSSQGLSAHSHANFGIKGDSSVVFWI